MFSKIHFLILISLLFAITFGTADAGEVLDDILNSMQLDQQLQRSGDDYLSITPDKPLGQTFVTGDKVVRICRIALHVAYWHEEWQPDETLVLTLWDSPQKKTSLGKFGIPYARRQWDAGILMFSVEAPVEPKKEYYFELTVEGGNGKIVGILLSKHDIPYPDGTGYEGGKAIERDIWFETHVKKISNRDADYAGFFDNFNLDYKGLEKVKAAVEKKDWDTACKEFLTYFEARKDLFPDDLATPKPEPNVDTREADLVADQKWPATDGSIVDLGPNWNYFATWPSLGGVGLTRTGLMKPLAFTYTKTGNEKYARAWNDMLISTFRNVPCPLKSGVITTEGRIGPLIKAGISGTLWDSISIAARLHHETFYNRFRKSPLFEPDVRMAWWVNLADMVNTLERMDAGGNWTTQNTNSLFAFAEKYPEFKKSKVWFSQGFNGIKANLLENTYPDGPLKEATTGYHAFSVGMFHNAITRAVELGLDVPREILERLEKTYEYIAYNTQPDWQVPCWGDTNRPLDQCALLEQGARYFKRPDLLWVATKGKEGQKPSRTSFAFPAAGYYIMRSAWGPSGKYLVTRNGFSNAHYHSDNLSTIVNCYGVDLLPDAGIYIYGTPECNELTQTKNHSTICVDGKNTAAGNGESFWHTLSGCDYYKGTNCGYHEMTDVKHQRMITFLKPDYWVVADRVTGPGEHTATQHWRFAPGKVDFDAAGIARTTNKAGGNIAVIPLRRDGRKDSISEEVYALSWEKATKSPVASFERQGPLPLAFCTVLFPYPIGNKGSVRAEDLMCDDTSLSTSVIGAKVVLPDSVDYVLFNTTAGNVKAGKLQTDAESVAVRTSYTTGKANQFSLFGGSSLTLGSTMLASSDAPVKGLSVKYSADTVTVDSEEPAPSLTVATLGAKKAMVNGKAVKLTKGAKTFMPFK